MKRKKKNKNKRSQFSLYFLIILWGAVLALAITMFCIGEFTDLAIKPSTYYIITIIVSFSSFVATSFFGISVYNHNSSVREQNEAITHQTNAVNRRAEAFRNLQFIASNYTIIDFVDFMKLYKEYDNYVERLKSNQSFQFYLIAEDVTTDDILQNFDEYLFLTVRLPMIVAEGKKTINKLRIKRFKFDKDEGSYKFISPLPEKFSDALILYSEAEKRNEAVINIAMRKDSPFFVCDTVNHFIRLQVQLEMESLLGVTVTGKMELYFNSPDRIDPNGECKYKILSSHFELIGMPRLTISKEFNPD